MNGFDSTHRLARSWEANAKAWTAAVREGSIESRRIATDQAIIDAVAGVAPTRVLDVGCGEGWLCRALGRSAVSCVGVDGSSELVSVAREADPEGQYLLLPYADFHRLGDLAGVAQFDAAVCNFSLLHEEIGSTLAAVRTTLRPGGVLLVQTLHPWTSCGDARYVDGWRIEDFSWSEHPFAASMPWYFRTLESWLRAVRTAGFQLRSLTEPAHPEAKAPLSLLLTVVAPGV